MSISPDALYAADLTGLAYATPCGGNQQSEHETCLTLAPIPGLDGAYALGDSKRPDAGPLRFTADELEAAGIDLSRFGLSA